MAEPVEALGQFPILQLALAAVIAGLGAVAAWRGVMAKPKRSSGDGVEWFLDGPVGKALGLFDGIYREMLRSREDRQRFADETNRKHDEQIALLRDINKKQDEQVALLDDLKDRMRDIAVRPGRAPRRD